MILLKQQKHVMKKVKLSILLLILKLQLLMFKEYIPEQAFKQEKQSLLVIIVILLHLFQELNQIQHSKRVQFLLVELIMQHFIQLQIDLPIIQQIKRGCYKIHPFSYS